MAAIRGFAPSDLGRPEGFAWCAQAGGEVGFMCWRTVWAGGRSLLEERDKPCLLSIRRHQRSTAALPFLKPGEPWWLLCLTGDRKTTALP